jgi:hypothetical protein
MRRFVLLVLAGAVWPAAALAADPPPAVADGLKAIKAVGPEGAGNEAAAKGWKEVVKGGAPALLPTLAAFDGASPAAANWLRSAVNAIAEGEKKAGRAVSKDDLGGFAADVKRNPAARRLAFELLQQQDKAAADALLPGFVNDPDPNLRRDAIAAKLKEMEPWANRDRLQKGLATLFHAARDQDQVEEIAKKLKEVEVTMNVTKHFGYVTEWHVSGEFDNAGLKGYAIAHPPEKEADRTGWKYAQSFDPYGNVDLNAAVADKKEVLAYAVATVVAEEETKCQIRLACQNAIKVFVNGKEVFAKEEYHSGRSMDQHVATVTLKKGANEVLVKVCQNDRAQPYMKPWEFAARVCDSTGGSLPLKQQISKDGKQVTVELGELAPAPKKKEEEKK